MGIVAPYGWTPGRHGIVRECYPSPPESGKANGAVIALLAKEWGVAKSAISVVSGATDRRKLVEIRGPSQELLTKLQGWLAARKD